MPIKNLSQSAMEQTIYTFTDSPLGALLLAQRNKKIVLTEYASPKLKIPLGKDWVEKPTLFSDAIKQLKEYFDGKRKTFDLEYELDGTAFQKKVWDELLKIPYGETISYKELARRAGNEKACRAVGGANNVNPVAIFVPCHRVIGSNNKMVGYASGIDKKFFLLKLEKAIA